MIINGKNTNSYKKSTSKGLEYYQNLKQTPDTIQQKMDNLWEEEKQTVNTSNNSVTVSTNDVLNLGRGPLSNQGLNNLISIRQVLLNKKDDEVSNNPNFDINSKIPLVMQQAKDSTERFQTDEVYRQDVINEIKETNAKRDEVAKEASFGTAVKKTALTPIAVLGELGAGVLEGGESLLDLATLGVNKIDTTVKDLQGKVIENVGKATNVDFIREYGRKKQHKSMEQDEFIKELVGTDLIGDSIVKANREFAKEYTYLPQKAGQLIETVGGMMVPIGGGAKLATKATTKIGQKVLGLLPFAIQAGGGASEQAIKEGASYEDALNYGIASGTIEAVIEGISGGIGGTVGNKVVGKIAKSKIGKEATKRIANNLIGKYALKLADAGIDVAGEGFEEVLATFADPFIKRLTYDEQAQMATSEELTESFWDGVFASILLKGGQAGVNKINENINNKNDEKPSELEKLIPTQKNDVPQSPYNVLSDINNQVIPNETKIAQKGDMEQTTQNDKVMDVLLGKKSEDAQNPVKIKAEETLNSARKAGMTDIDIKRATELNDLLQSNARLQFYDENNLPQEFSAEDIKKVKIANGLYSNGTIYINKNSKNVVEKILGHELTHHLETTGSFNDLANTILDSDVFYDYITEKGFQNVQAFKQSLLENGYSEQQLDNEMVARFVEDNLFSNQKSINRLVRKNATLAEKIKNFISDLKVKLKGTAQEKQLLKIENMYRKALEQARNNADLSTDTQYSIAGIKGAKRLRKNPQYNNIIEQYKNAKKLYKEGYDNARLIEETGWYRDNKGNWKYEFSDEDMTLKKNIKLDDKGIYALDKMLEHDILFEAYPQLKNYTVIFANIGKGNRAGIFAPAKIILLNPNYANTKATIEYELAHEIQHAIQVIEGFPRSTSKKNGGYAYYSSLGEIEARDVSERLRMLQNERKQFMPETAKENPIHEGMERYLQNRSEAQRIQDEEYIQKQEAKEKIKESIKSFFEKGGIGYDQDIEMDNNQNNTETQSETDRILRNENTENKRVAGKQSAFSMPKNPVEIAKNPPNPQTGLDKIKRGKRVKEGDTQSNFSKNVLNQNIFDEKFKDLALNDNNIRSYDRITNKETLQKANDAINEQGQKWVDRFKDKANGDMKAEDIAGGFILMNRYQQVGDYESMISIAEKLRKAGTQQGQTIQMFSVLGRMTPEGMTYYAQKTLSDAYDEILKNKTKAWADEHADDFKLTEKDIDFIQRRVNQASKLPESRDKYVLLGEIAERIQNKIPPRSGQGLKALARISMLLNSKTMIRNVLGNVVIVPNHIVSDFIGSAIDKKISKKTGVRTTGSFTMSALTGIKKGVYESFDDFRRGISTREIAGNRFEIGQGKSFEIGQGKSFNENHTGRFSKQRNNLNKALNGLDRVTSFLLETGDRPFYETWFINSINNQMRLNNVTEPTAEMIEIATDEALQRTWQDNNTYTRGVSGIRRFFNLANIKGYGLGDVIMPFVKTPANLTKAVVDFSPLGAINAAIKTSQFNKDIGKGEVTNKQQREVVKAWSQVITGTLGMVVMTAFANAGILTGSSDEDKDVRNFEQNVLGIKPYSIKIGNKSFTYDWAQPLGTTAAIVADMTNSLKNADDNESKTTAILKSLTSGSSVLLNQSFVSGIRSFLEEDGLINAIIEVGFNEPAKFTPQFLSQIAQLQDDIARTTYVYNNIPQTAVNKIKAKIPGLRQTLEPSVDVLGREAKTNNSIFNILLNPANTGKANSTKESEEMYKVYKETGDKATIAPVAPYYITVDTQKIALSPKQRTQYQKTTGQIALESIDTLLKNDSYNKSKPEEKAEVLKEVYSYANAVAKTEVSDYELSDIYQDIQQSGADVADVLLARKIVASKDTRDEKEKALISNGYSKSQATKFLDWLNKNVKATKKVDGEKVRKENYLKNVF